MFQLALTPIDQAISPLFFSVCAWALMASFAWSCWCAACEGAKHLRRLHQIPCDRCVYFTGDYRLKCTVHPVIALSEDAIACLDFEPTSRPAPVSQPCQSCKGTKLPLGEQKGRSQNYQNRSTVG